MPPLHSKLSLRSGMCLLSDHCNVAMCLYTAGWLCVQPLTLHALDQALAVLGGAICQRHAGSSSAIMSVHQLQRIAASSRQRVNSVSYNRPGSSRGTAVLEASFRARRIQHHADNRGMYACYTRFHTRAGFTSCVALAHCDTSSPLQTAVTTVT
jgi:hypothetical protein